MTPKFAINTFPFNAVPTFAEISPQLDVITKKHTDEATDELQNVINDSNGIERMQAIRESLLTELHAVVGTLSAIELNTYNQLATKARGETARRAVYITQGKSGLDLDTVTEAQEAILDGFAVIKRMAGIVRYVRQHFQESLIASGTLATDEDDTDSASILN